MKKNIFLLFLSSFSFLGYTCLAQDIYPVAVSSSGILLDKYKTENNATNPLPDSISIEEAKSIFALNIISVLHDRKIKKEKVIRYQLTIIEHEQTTTITNNTELLSEEMKTRLSRIESGSKIYFEGILAGDSEIESRNVIILYFVVI